MAFLVNERKRLEMLEQFPAHAELADRDGVSRRSVVSAAAWSVPAVMLVAATPARAAVSNAPSVTITVPATGFPATGSIAITVTAKDSSGQALAGQAVSLSAPAPGTFAQTTGTTDGAGTFTTNLSLGTPWVEPGTTMVVTAVVGSIAQSQPFLILGANVLGWGYNAWRELGDGGAAGGDSAGSGVLRSSPSQLLPVFPSPVVQVVSCGMGQTQGSNQSTVVLLKDGSVWAVGGNGFGQLGDGTSSSSATWVQVPGLSGVTQVSAGTESVYALKSDGSVVAWGDNWFGQLGTGASGNSASSPQSVSGVSNVVQVSAGSQQVFFLLGDGTVWSVGRNSSYALGDGSSVAMATAPVQVSGLSGVIQIAGRGAGCHALKSDGTVWSWGSDSYGAAGQGTMPVPSSSWMASAPTPVQVQGLSGVTVKQIAGCFNGGMALSSTGAVFAWGDNSAGFVGDGTTSSRSSATAVSGLGSGVSQIAASGGTGGSGYALKSDGTVAAWGDNSSSQLGTGTTTNATTPVTVTGLNGLPITSLMTQSPTSSRMYAIAGSATVAVTVDPQVSAGSAGVVKVTAMAGTTPISGAPLTISAGSGVALGATSGTTNGSGVFQTSATMNRWTTPGTVSSISAASNGVVGSASFLTLGANVLGWGYNAWRELGDGGAAGGDSAGSGVLRSSPSQLLPVFPSPVVQVVSCGMGQTQGSNQSTVVLLKDGSVWAVGGNGFGQLGNGSMLSKSAWQPVPGLSGVTQVSAGTESVYALKSDGSVLAWGDNWFGQLGTGASGNSASSPQSVSGVSNVVQVSAGSQQVFFLRGDGTVWSVGRNNSYALGDGSSVAIATAPVQVSGLSGVIQIAGRGGGGHALKSDGTVWSWGSDYSGAVGQGTTPVPPPWTAGAPDYSAPTPVQVQGLSGVTVKQIAGWVSGGAALSSTGAVFAWGDNSAGFVGDGTTSSRSSATAVSGLGSGVSQIAASGGTGGSGYALKSDGTVVAWGDNSSSQLGTGTTTNATTPVAVTGLKGLPITGLMTFSGTSNRMYAITAP